MDFKESQLETLGAFCKDKFDIQKAFQNAGNLKYIKQFEQVIENEYRKPTDDFVRYLLDKSEIYDGIKTAKVIEKHRKTTIEAFNLFMSKVMKTSLDFSLTKEPEETNPKTAVKTTLEELEGYAIVKSILHGYIDTSRVCYRDNLSYFNVLLDDKIYNTICRLYFNRSQKYIAFIEGKKEIKNPINTPDDIFNFAEQIKNKVNELIALKK